ncbi:hypothetical protein EDB83DRAFT_2398202 [Lactarius deliciosus]|nr:hypothetical protein EDB83DRAFT_2398202 [Lactarius deliciosus]
MHLIGHSLLFVSLGLHGATHTTASSSSTARRWSADTSTTSPLPLSSANIGFSCGKPCASSAPRTLHVFSLAHPS